MRLGPRHGDPAELGSAKARKSARGLRVYWVAVKELNLSYYIRKPYYVLYIPIMVT